MNERIDVKYINDVVEEIYVDKASEGDKGLLCGILKDYVKELERLKKNMNKKIKEVRSINH